MLSSPSTVNLADFYQFAMEQGVPATALPNGTLSSLVIAANTGAATAVSSTGTVAAGFIIDGGSLTAQTLYLSTWAGLSGTVLPASTVSNTIPLANVYSQYTGYALNYAVINALGDDTDGAGMAGFPPPYVSACYNLAMHQLLKVAQDYTGTFFSGIRKEYGLNSFRSGVIGGSSDESTSQTLVTPELFASLTMSALDLTKTPYGREYLSYAQAYGANIVDVS